MKRSALPLVLLFACTDPSPDVELTSAAHELGSLAVTRTHVTGDIYHYELVLPLGDGPYDDVSVHRVVRERAPWLPIRSDEPIVLLHGDFSSFRTQFAPYLAPWLAARDVDVWGIDQRWTKAARFDTDFSTFDAMSLEQELDDIGIALAFIRGMRLFGGAGGGGVTLSGFSRGGQLAYFYTSREATWPRALRHVSGLVPLDVYAELPPDDVEFRQFHCANAAYARGELAAGVFNSYNVFPLTVGRLALLDPTAPSPWDPSLTAREMMLWFVGQTYVVFRPSPVYHLAGPVLDDTGNATGLRFSSETAIATWLAGAAPHQSWREQADTDALVCGEGQLPLDVPLSRIRVPVLSIAAAGGYGERASYSASQVGSTDVTTLVIRALPVEQEAEDYGHADVLFAADAPERAWQPLLSWLRAH